jgi:pyridoxal phosphate enzyme (YggS family)
MGDQTTSAKQLRENLAEIKARMADACARADACTRSERATSEPSLVAVSKTHPPSAIRTLYDAGQRHFGESYVQEWQDKAGELPDDIVWHFIGHLQSNKAKYLADEIRLVHSVDRKSVMKKLHRRSNERVDVLLQVNIAAQDTKSGVAPDELMGLLERTRDYPSVIVCGLMTIPPYVDDPEDNREHFRRMRELFEQARVWLEANAPQDVDRFEHLSMGMTGDFEVAIEEGATLVRVGTGIFGKRQYDQ